MPDEISNKLEQIIKQIKPSARFNLSADLRKDFGLDSLDMLSFFFEAEKMFSIKIPEEDVSNYELINMNKIKEYIKQRTNN